jgi:hypothetical protein
MVDHTQHPDRVRPQAGKSTRSGAAGLWKKCPHGEPERRSITRFTHDCFSAFALIPEMEVAGGGMIIVVSMFFMMVVFSVYWRAEAFPLSL